MRSGRRGGRGGEAAGGGARRCAPPAHGAAAGAVRVGGARGVAQRTLVVLGLRRAQRREQDTERAVGMQRGEVLRHHRALWRLAPNATQRMCMCQSLNYKLSINKYNIIINNNSS